MQSYHNGTFSKKAYLRTRLAGGRSEEDIAWLVRFSGILADDPSTLSGGLGEVIKQHSVLLQEPFVTCHVKHDTPCNISRHLDELPRVLM